MSCSCTSVSICSRLGRSGPALGSARNDLEPRRNLALAGLRVGHDERGHLAGLVADLDDVVGRHPVTGDVDLVAVDGDDRGGPAAGPCRGSWPGQRGTPRCPGGSRGSSAGSHRSCPAGGWPRRSSCGTGARAHRRYGRTSASPASAASTRLLDPVPAVLAGG